MLKVVPAASFQLLLSEDTFSVESMDQAREWLLECEQGHTRRRFGARFLSLPAETLPTRLINVGILAALISKLEHFRGLPFKTSYLGLSQCWGERVPIQLTSFSLNEFTIWIDHERLPTTFREAMDITRRLGARYLCIYMRSILLEGLRV